MAYNFFTQPQGPNIDVNLIPNAMKAGAQVGNEIPSTTKSIIDGLLGGVQTGQKIVDSYQNEQLTQNKIEQLPVTNAIQAENLNQEQSQSKIQNVQANVAQQTETSKVDATNAVDANTQSQAQYQTQLRNRMQEFTQAFQQSDPLKQKQMVLSGQWADVQAANPNLFTATIRPVYQYLSPDEQDAVNFNGKKNSLDDYYAKQAQQHATKFSEAKAQLADHWAAKDASTVLGLPPDQIADKVTIVPHGQYAEDPKEKMIPWDEDSGHIATVPNYDTNMSGGKYDLVAGRRVVAQGLSKDDLRPFKDFQVEKAWVDGSYHGKAVSDLKGDFDARKQSRQSQPGPGLPGPILGQSAPVTAAPSNQAPASQAPTYPEPQAQQGAVEQQGGAPQARQAFAPDKPASDTDVAAQFSDTGAVGQKVTPQPSAVNQVRNVPVTTQRDGSINVASNPQAYTVVQKALGLPTDDFKKVIPQVRTVLQMSEVQPQGWFGKYSADQQTQLEDAKSKLVSFTAGTAFDKDPDLQKQYTDDLVAAHNRAVDNFKTSLDNPFSDIGSALSLGASGLTIDQLVHVDSPRDLYILKNGGLYNGILDNLIREYRSHVKDSQAAMLKRGSLQSSLFATINK